MPSNCPISSPISWCERLSAFHSPAPEAAPEAEREYSRSRVCAFSRVIPVPRFLGRGCSGRRVTSKRRSPTVNSSTTSVGVSGSAWSLRSESPLP